MIYERSCLLVLKYNNLKQLLWESLNDITFINTSNKMPKHCFFAEVFSDRRLNTRCYTKGAAYYYFRRALSNRYFGKVLLIHFTINWNNLLVPISIQDKFHQRHFLPEKLLRFGLTAIVLLGNYF